LSGGGPLALGLAAFKAGSFNATTLAWVFVRARVESHSPSFNWEEARIEKLIELVTECSQSPHFTAKTSEDLARELVRAQAEEREELQRSFELLSRNLSATARIAREATLPSYAKVTEQYGKIIDQVIGRVSVQNEDMFRSAESGH